MRPTLLAPTAVAAAAALALTACGSDTRAASAPRPSTLPPVTVSAPADGSTVQLGVGQTLHVVLGAPDRAGSTYWRFAPAPSPLRQSGAVSTVPGSRTGGCARPGSGCGTVTLTVVGTSPGRATITAGRDSCGEVMRCDQAQASLHLVVEVA